MPSVKNLALVDESRVTFIDPVGLYRLTSFLRLTAYSRAGWFILMDKGRAPRPAVQPHKRLSLWRGADILAWLEDPSTYRERVAVGQAGYPTLEKYVA